MKLVRTLLTALTGAAVLASGPVLGGPAAAAPAPAPATAAAAAPAASGFADVPPGTAFADEIAWVDQRGIATGWPRKDGTREYRPLSPVNRDAMAAFLHRMGRALRLPDLPATGPDRPRRDGGVPVPVRHGRAHPRGEHLRRPAPRPRLGDPAHHQAGRRADLRRRRLERRGGSDPVDAAGQGRPGYVLRHR